jgi:uncharacterized protein (UPF0332 family)
MTGNDFIAVAGRIAATYSDAASCRTAISRAYYGAFHLGKSFLADIGITPPRNANTHVFVQHRLAGSGHLEAIKVASLLGDLHEDRLHADYNLDRKHIETVAHARASVERAMRIQTVLNECMSAESKAAIEEYEKKISAGS